MCSTYSGAPVMVPTYRRFALGVGRGRPCGRRLFPLGSGSRFGSTLFPKRDTEHANPKHRPHGNPTAGTREVWILHFAPLYKVVNAPPHLRLVAGVQLRCDLCYSRCEVPSYPAGAFASLRGS